MMANKAKLETFRGEDGQYYVKIVAPNGEPLFVSEAYTRPYDAEEAIFTLIGIMQSGFYNIVHEGEVQTYERI